MKIRAIKTKDKVYISSDDGKSSYSPNTEAGRLLYDGEVPKNTHKPGWYSIDKWPESVQRKVPGKQTNYRWELKQGYPATELTPAVLTASPNDEDSQYYEVAGLYVRHYDTLPETVESVEVEWEILADIPSYEIRNWKYKGTSNYLIDQITTDPVLLSEVPCQIGGAQLYAIIRQYIKQNINGKYARVTSDYDFSFEVKKSLAYSEPVPYTTTESVGRSKTKTRPVTKYRTGTDIMVYKMGDGRSNYPPYPVTIKANNQRELEEKVEQYLKELIEMINEPLVVCSCCKGRGAVIDKQ